MARKLQPEEWDLWRRVADTAIPIQPLAAVKPQGLAKIINKVHKQITKLKYVGVYAMYDRANFIADKYYKKNYFTIYDKEF